MSSFEREFNSAVEAVERDVFINLVCENPQLTLAELTKLGKGKFANLLSTVSVGDILESARGQDHESKNGKTKSKGKSGKLMCSYEDVNADGYDDLVCHFENAEGAWASGQTEASLTGKLKTKPVNTRTPEGRRQYDAAVFGVVEAAERPIKAPEITAQVGGTALQVRKALARLIDAGKVTWEGKARGMRYSAIEDEDEDEAEVEDEEEEEEEE